MIASLPMYDRPETTAAHDRLWTLIKDALMSEGIHAPAQLTRGAEGLDHWRDPDLLLSQTCGLPYRAHLHGKVSLVGTPVLALDAPEGHYYSVLVARGDDDRETFRQFKGSMLACNAALSQSGWAAPQNMATAHGFAFERVTLTSAHRASALAVRDGRADIAAIDAITWTLIRRHDAWASDLKAVDKTPPTPALPYITASGGPVDSLRRAMADAVTALSGADRDALCLRGFTQIEAQNYLSVPTPGFPKVTCG